MKKSKMISYRVDESGRLNADYTKVDIDGFSGLGFLIIMFIGVMIPLVINPVNYESYLELARAIRRVNLIFRFVYYSIFSLIIIGVLKITRMSDIENLDTYVNYHQEVGA